MSFVSRSVHAPLNVCVCVRACVRDEVQGMVGELKAK